MQAHRSATILPRSKAHQYGSLMLPSGRASLAGKQGFKTVQASPEFAERVDVLACCVRSIQGKLAPQRGNSLDRSVYRCQFGLGASKPCLCRNLLSVPDPHQFGEPFCRSGHVLNSSTSMPRASLYAIVSC
jgi:hypothetical protein